MLPQRLGRGEASAQTADQSSTCMFNALQRSLTTLDMPAAAAALSNASATTAGTARHAVAASEMACRTLWNHATRPNWLRPRMRTRRLPPSMTTRMLRLPQRFSQVQLHELDTAPHTHGRSPVPQAAGRRHCCTASAEACYATKRALRSCPFACRYTQCPKRGPQKGHMLSPRCTELACASARGSVCAEMRTRSTSTRCRPQRAAHRVPWAHSWTPLARWRTWRRRRPLRPPAS